jgi:hypothetical protein
MPKFVVQTPTQNPQQVLDRMNRHPHRAELAKDLEQIIKWVIAESVFQGASKEETTERVKQTILVYGVSF